MSLLADELLGRSPARQWGLYGLAAPWFLGGYTWLCLGGWCKQRVLDAPFCSGVPSDTLAGHPCCPLGPGCWPRALPRQFLQGQLSLLPLPLLPLPAPAPARLCPCPLLPLLLLSLPAPAPARSCARHGAGLGAAPPLRHPAPRPGSAAAAPGFGGVWSSGWRTLGPGAFTGLEGLPFFSLTWSGRTASLHPRRRLSWLCSRRVGPAASPGVQGR